jgi:hypothetical protein
MSHGHIHVRGAKVVLIVQPFSSDANAYGCVREGGVLIVFDDGDVQLCIDINSDEDIAVVARDNSRNSSEETA